MPAYYTHKTLTDRQREFAGRWIESVAFGALVIDAIERGSVMSVVRLGDAELALWRAGGRQPGRACFHDPEWMRYRFGEPVDWAALHAAVVAVAREASYIAASPGGISNPIFDVSEFAPRERYVSVHYVGDWVARGVAREILDRAPRIAVVNRASEFICRNLRRVCQSEFIPLALPGPSAIEQCLDAIQSAQPQLVLMAASLAGRVMVSHVAQAGGCVALDCGIPLVRWAEQIARGAS